MLAEAGRSSCASGGPAKTTGARGRGTRPSERTQANICGNGLAQLRVWGAFKNHGRARPENARERKGAESYLPKGAG
eukprot:14407217-Alexandrium_andersonii.AAC.1